MCGFTGLLSGAAPTGSDELAGRMGRVQDAIHAIRHRGPDEQRFWQDGHCTLGFARLAIVDLAGGSQPMQNEDGRLRLVYNGEIYNHLELRRELIARGHRFATDHSDSEVLLHGWEEWREGLLPRLNGMFAFLIWDAQRRELVVGRDRYGIKPIYWSRTGDAWIFASEIKAVLATGLVPSRRDDAAVAEYLFQQNTWGARTFFSGVQEFPKAQAWVLRDGAVAETICYWSGERTRDSRLSYPEAVEQHRHLLGQAVKSQMMADVPVMSYLSGGIDSSAIAALATRESDDVAGYACLFDLDGVGDDRVVDEREYSRAAASHLGIPLNELMLSPRDLETSLDPTIRALETPRMGMAYVNFRIADRVARDSKVVLSGTGGDEFHAGYIGRYQYLDSPPAPPATAAGRMRSWIDSLLDSGTRARAQWETRARVLLNFPLRFDEAAAALEPDFLAGVDAGAIAAEMDRRIRAVTGLPPAQAMLRLDSDMYLHGLLVLEDKLAMAHSLEARVPLLDNDLVDFVQALPMDYLRSVDVGKKVFRDSVRPLLPEVIADKPKMGFGPPDASWYRKQLRPFVEERLLGPEFRHNGVIRPQVVEQRVKLHMSGTQNHTPFIWSCLSLQSWMSQFA